MMSSDLTLSTEYRKILNLSSFLCRAPSMVLVDDLRQAEAVWHSESGNLPIAKESRMATIERPALIEVQRGQLMISTTLTPAQLERYAKVDIYDPEHGTDPANGYQRRGSRARMAQAAEFYGEGQLKKVGRIFEDRRGLMPNPIIANVRPSEDDEALTVEGNGFPP